MLDDLLGGKDSPFRQDIEAAFVIDDAGSINFESSIDCSDTLGSWDGPLEVGAKVKNDDHVPPPSVHSEFNFDLEGSMLSDPDFSCLISEQSDRGRNASMIA